jgi:hypothetical protein
MARLGRNRHWHWRHSARTFGATDAIDTEDDEGEAEEAARDVADRDDGRHEPVMSDTATSTKVPSTPTAIVPSALVVVAHASGAVARHGTSSPTPGSRSLAAKKAHGRMRRPAVVARLPEVPVLTTVPDTMIIAGGTTATAASAVRPMTSVASSTRTRVALSAVVVTFSSGVVVLSGTVVVGGVRSIDRVALVVGGGSGTRRVVQSSVGVGVTLSVDVGGSIVVLVSSKAEEEALDASATGVAVVLRMAEACWLLADASGVVDGGSATGAGNSGAAVTSGANHGSGGRSGS